MTLDLTDDEAAALASFIRRALDDDRFPLSQRLAPLRAILAKLEPPQPQPKPPPPLKASMAPSAAADPAEATLCRPLCIGVGSHHDRARHAAITLCRNAPFFRSTTRS